MTSQARFGLLTTYTAGKRWRRFLPLLLCAILLMNGILTVQAQDSRGTQPPSTIAIAPTAVAPTAVAPTKGVAARPRLGQSEEMMRSVRRLQQQIAALKAAASRKKIANARRGRHEPGRVEEGQRAARTDAEHPTGKSSTPGSEPTRIIARQVRSKEAEKKEAEKEETGKDEAKKEEEDAGTEYLEAYLYYLRQRAYPKDSIDPNALPRAVRQRDRMQPATGIGHHSQQGGFIVPHSIGLPNQWQFIGPTNLDIPYVIYYGIPPLSGRINAVAYDPVNKGVYYIAGATGGVWKTTDSGKTWTPLADTWPELPVSSLAIDPTDTNTIYAGTGDFDGSLGHGIGIMKSMDGGQTWTQIDPLPTDPNNPATGMDGYAISAILIDPENHNTLTATLGRGQNTYGYVWRSTNAGQTWSSVLQVVASWSGLSCSAKDNTGKRYYYASTPATVVNGQFTNAQVYYSVDRGVTWSPLTLPFNATAQIKVAASPNFPATLYVLDGADSKIWKSVNAGSTWSDTTNNFSNDWSQVGYDKHIEVGTGQNAQGVTQDVVYVGLIDLVRSTNGGTTWNSIGGPTTSTNALTHNDQHALMLNPNNPAEALVGNDGGAYLLTFNANGNPSYNSLNANLGVTQFYTADFHPTDPTTMIGGAQDNATPVALNGLSTWYDVVGGDGGGCAINQLTPTVQYGTIYYYSSIERTSDSWNSVGDITPNFGNDTIAFIPPLTLDPTTPSRLYAATNYLYRYHDNTTVWDSRLGNQQLAESGYYVQCIAVAPSDGNRIYTGSLDGEVWMTTDGGTTWTEIDTVNGNNTSLPGLAIQSIAVSPTNPSNIMVGLSGSGSPHLWACTNTLAGTNLNWNSLSGTGGSALPDASLNSIAIDIDDPVNTYYAGTDIGVFQTLDGGNTWQNATNPLGLPNVQVNVLKPIPGTRYLNAATYGRGMWRIKLNTAILSVTLNPTSVVGGTPVTGTVTISDPAPLGGFPISLGTDNAKVAAPAVTMLTIPQGQITASFNINTQWPLNPPTLTVNISASANGITRTAPLTVQNTAVPYLAVSATLTRTSAGIVVNITLTNNGAAAADSVQVTMGSLINQTTHASANGNPLPLSFGSLAAGKSNTQTITFPASIGQTGNLSLLRISGSYQQAAPNTGTGSFVGSQQQNLP
jgi:photosystem II stability/assembly factor-like uncharacterized protein